MIKVNKSKKIKKFLVLSLSFMLCVLHFTFLYALDLDNLKLHFLRGDYTAAIKEGEKILATGDQYTANLDELYYILGLSYLKDGNYLRASDIFEIILKEFKRSKYSEKARLGLADTYFLRGDLIRAEKYYKELLDSKSNNNLQQAIYYRLSQLGFKKGDTKEAKEFLDKLKENSLSLELTLNSDVVSNEDADLLYYTVQVGSFSKAVNANNLMEKLKRQGYPAYTQEVGLQRLRPFYRVKVGKYQSRQEAQDLAKKLSLEGYPTKICP